MAKLILVLPVLAMGIPTPHGAEKIQATQLFSKAAPPPAPPPCPDISSCWREKEICDQNLLKEGKCCYAKPTGWLTRVRGLVGEGLLAPTFRSRALLSSIVATYSSQAKPGQVQREGVRRGLCHQQVRRARQGPLSLAE